MPRTFLIPLLLALWFVPTGLKAAPTAEIKVRETSFFVGTPFNFYVQVNDVINAPEPDLLSSDSLQISYIGAAPSIKDGKNFFTFTYEAIPTVAGKATIPGGLVSIGNQDIPFALTEIDVAYPETTEEMELIVELSHQECYVGEPVLLTFRWITNLSLNGIKAAQIRIPALTDYQFQVREPLETVDVDADNSIGLPVSNQRIISAYTDTNRNEKPAVELRFQRLIIPTRVGELPLLIKPASLVCSYTEPRDGAFKGTRYPSYFNNDFFDEDVTGTYQRLMVMGEPMTLKVKPLPSEGQPANFSGIVGGFTIKATANPTVVEVNEPILLSLEVRDKEHPHILELPALSSLPALNRSFAAPNTPIRPSIKSEAAIFTQSIRPQHDEIPAIPALEFSYFDPIAQAYGFARTEPITITVNPVSSVDLSDAAFSDGSAIKNPVQPQPGGIYANYTGPDLLVSRRPPSWTAYASNWMFAWLGPPALFGLVWYLSRNHRIARRDPVLAKHRRAYGRFRFALWKLGPDPEPDQLSHALKTYLQERFDVPHFESGARELRSIASQADVDPDETDILVGLIDSTAAIGYSRHEVAPPPVKREGLLQLVRKLEQRAGKVAAIFLFLALTLTSLRAAEPASLLNQAEELFARANEASQVDPSKAAKFYALAAERFESLIRDHEVENGQLYSNLGNTHFLSGDIGHAILNYRRAETYLPGNTQLRDTLRYVRTQRVDVFPEETTALVVKRVFFWHFLFSPRTRSMLLATLFAGIWLVLSIHLVWPLRQRWQIIAGLGIGMFLLASSSLIHAFNDTSQDAVIVEREVMARKGDSFIYDSAFSTALHSGTEIRILEQRRDWFHIRTPDRNEGWIPVESAERVQF